MFTLFLKCCLSSVAILLHFFYSSTFVPGLMASAVFSSDICEWNMSCNVHAEFVTLQDLSILAILL